METNIVISQYLKLKTQAHSSSHRHSSCLPVNAWLSRSQCAVPVGAVSATEMRKAATRTHWWRDFWGVDLVRVIAIQDQCQGQHQLLTSRSQTSCTLLSTKMSHDLRELRKTVTAAMALGLLELRGVELTTFIPLDQRTTAESTCATSGTPSWMSLSNYTHLIGRASANQRQRSSKGQWSIGEACNGSEGWGYAWIGSGDAVCYAIHMSRTSNPLTVLQKETFGFSSKHVIVECMKRDYELKQNVNNCLKNSMRVDYCFWHF